MVNYGGGEGGGGGGGALLAGNAKVSDGFDSGAAAGGWITNRYPATAQIQLIFTLFTLS